MNDISITSAMRTNLFSLKNTDNLINKAQERLSTGKRVNNALDNPTNFFAARAHTFRASDLNNLKDGIREAVQVIKASETGNNAITNILREAAAIADTATTTANRDELLKFINNYNSMRNQLDLIAKDSSYMGTNLLLRQDLSVDLGNDSRIILQGADTTSSGFDNMTNGLNFEAPNMDPLNTIVQSTVVTSAGDIKQDGSLTITNNNLTGIDNWLTGTGIKTQIITSQNVSVSGRTISDGLPVQTQILDAKGIAEYGNNNFSLYRETTGIANITGGTSVINATLTSLNRDAAAQYLGAIENSATKGVDISRTTVLDPPTKSGSGSVSNTLVVDQAALDAFFGATPSNGSKSFTLTYNSATKQWAANAGITVVGNNGNGALPPTSLSLNLTGSGTAVTLDVTGWNNGDTITYSAKNSWVSSDPAVKVRGNTNPLSLDLDLNGDNNYSDGAISLSGSSSTDTKIRLDISCSSWKSTDSTIGVSGGSAQITADLNGDGTDDMLLQFPGGGLSTETISVSTSGAFRTDDSSVSLKYDSSLNSIDLFFNGESNAPDMSVNLSGSWAVNQLSTSPNGNGDSLKLIVDGRHRWVNSSNSGPNSVGIRFSMTEIEKAIKTVQLNSAKMASGLSILTIRNNFISNMSDILVNGAENLTLADMNEEGANMLTLQTRQSLEITALDLVNRSSQNILRLF